MAQICTRTVVVIGGAYGGGRAAQVLASELPKGWRVILVDRNSHANLVPYDNVFRPVLTPSAPSLEDRASTLFLHATVTSISPKSVTLSHSFPEHGFHDGVIPYDYMVYALGAGLPDPVNLWSDPPPCIRSADAKDIVEEKEVYEGRKPQSIRWLKKMQERIKQAETVLVVGGGALGIQFATDIAEIYPEKEVTLLHSRTQLLNRFDGAVHAEVLQSLEALGVTPILGERLATFPGPDCKGTVKTTTGREITADLILTCTGQIPNTSILEAMDPRVVDPQTRMARVKRTMQLALVSPSSSASSSSHDMLPFGNLSAYFDDMNLSSSASEAGGDDEEHLYDHIFVIGDAADAFGALKAGHNAYNQGNVAARNIAKLAKQQMRREEVVAQVVVDDDEVVRPNRRRSSSIPVEDHDYDDDKEDDDVSISSSSSSSSSSSAASSDDESMVSDLEDADALEDYHPGPPAIKVTLGVRHSVYQINDTVGTKDDGVDDCDAGAIWPYFGFKVQKEEDLLL